MNFIFAPKYFSWISPFALKQAKANARLLILMFFSVFCTAAIQPVDLTHVLQKKVIYLRHYTKSVAKCVYILLNCLFKFSISSFFGTSKTTESSECAAVPILYLNDRAQMTHCGKFQRLRTIKNCGVI